MRKEKVIVTGAAGLVGQNLMQRLTSRGYEAVVAIDKHPANTGTLARLFPSVTVIEADLAQPGDWEAEFADARVLILNHAQISAIDEQPFLDNNVTATVRTLEAARRHGVPYVVHISSSVVNSLARDFYTQSKKAQEQLVVNSGIPACVLRPTLMFGWFDRKHLGWLARFMKRTPLFPVPGSGRYVRQPLYVGDFCEVVISCAETPRPGMTFNISGHEKVFYIDLVKAVNAAARAHSRMVRIPYALFWLLLRLYGLVDRNPPFTTQQLEALVIPETFEIIDWPAIFGVSATPLTEALQQTFRHPTYSGIALEF